jgi:pSer/pThr/pTyr-binding forkhead associated (FHA) protein
LGFLKQIEKSMESLVEGVFGRAFRRQVHPVEIAKGLTKQMDEGRMISVSRTYAPNDFTIHLSAEDHESMQAYERSLRDELIQYASTHAENKHYHLMTPPKVRFETEETLKFGEFGVTAKLTGGEGPRERGAPSDTSGQTKIFRTEEPEEPEESEAPESQRETEYASGGSYKSGDTASISAEQASREGLARETVELTIGQETQTLEGNGPWTVGRAEDNDVVIPDPNISRRHARLERHDNGFVVEDLGSTNGTLLDGAPIGRERIDDGDEITFGHTPTTFNVRRSQPRGRQASYPGGAGGPGGVTSRWDRGSSGSSGSSGASRGRRGAGGA